MKKILSLHKFSLLVYILFAFVTVQLIATQQAFAGAHLIWRPAGVNTNWSNANNWRISTYGGATASNAPIAADTAEIGPNNSNFTVILDVDTSVSVLIISGTGQIFINGSTKTLRVTGDLSSTNTNTTGGGSATIKITGTSNQSLSGNTSATNKGKFCNITIDKSGGTVTFYNYITMGGSTKLKYTAGTIDAGTSTVCFYLTNTIEGSFTFNDVEFMATSSTITLANNQTITGDLTLSGTSYLYLNTSTINLEGDLNINYSGTYASGSATINLTGTNNQSITSTVAIGTGYIPNLKFSKTSGTISLSGIISIASSLTNNYSASTSTILYGTSELFFLNTTAGGTYSTPVYDVTMGGAGNSTNYFSRDSALIVKHQLKLKGTSYIKMYNHSILIEGNIQQDNSNSNTIGNTCELIIGGAGNQTIASSVALGASYLQAIKIQKSSGTVSLSGIISICGTWTNNYSTANLNAGTSKLYFITPNGTNIIGGSYSTRLYDVVFGGTSNSTISFGKDSALIITDTMFYSATASIALNNYSVNIEGAIKIDNTHVYTGGTSTLVFKGSQNQSIISTVGITKGNLCNVKIEKTGGVLSLVGIISSYGNWINNYSTVNVNAGNSKLYFFAPNGSTTIGGTYSTKLYDAKFGGTSNTTIVFASDSALIITDTMQTSGSSMLLFNSHSVKITGTLKITNTCAVNGGSALFLISGSANQSIISTVAKKLDFLPSIVIEKTGGILSLFGVISLVGNWTNNYSTANINSGTSELYFYNATNNATYTMGGTYSTPVYRLTIENIQNGYRNLTVDSAFIISDTFKILGTGYLNISGYSIVANGSIVNNNTSASTIINSTLYLKGSSNQYLKGTNDLKCYKVEMNKTANSLTLNNGLTITNNLTFTTGNIISTSTNLLTFNDNATVTGASNSSFVSGPCRKTGNDLFVFPCGKNSHYSPLTISAPSTTSDAFVAEYFDEKSSTTAFSSPLTFIDPCEYHNLNHTVGSSTTNVTLSWNNPCFHIASLSYINIARDSSSKWVKGLGTYTTTGNTTTGTITSNTARSTWGDITLAKTNPLVVANAGRDTAVCFGQSVTLGGAPTGSGGTTSLSYSWSPSTGLSNGTVANPVATPTVTTTYIVTVTDAISEFTNDTVVMIVNPSFTADAGNNQTICVGGEVVLGNGNVATGGTPLYAFYWYNPDTVFSREMYVDYYPADNDTFILEVMDSVHCYARDTVEILVHPAVSIDMFTDTIIPFKGSIVLGGSPTYSGGTSPYFIKWSPSDFLDDTTIANPTITDLINTVVYNLYVSDDYGCYATQNVNVHPDFPEADSSMHFSLLSGGDIVVADSSYVFENVGAYGTITGLLFSDEDVWDGNPPVVNGALEDLDSLMDEIEAFTLKDTVVSDLVASGVRTTGIYYVKDSAVIDGDWTISGDSSSMYIVCIQDSLIIQSHARIILDGISASQLIVYANKKIHSYGFSDLSGVFISRDSIILDTVACPSAFRTLGEITANRIYLNKISEIHGRPSAVNLLTYTVNTTPRILDNDGDDIMDFWGVTIENYSAANPTAGLGNVGGFNNIMVFRKINKIHPGFIELHLDESWDWNQEWYYGSKWLQYKSQSISQINKGQLSDLMIPVILEKPITVHNRQTDFKFSLDGTKAKAEMVFNLLGPSQEYNFLRLKQALNLNIDVDAITLGNEMWGSGVHQNLFYKNVKRYIKTANLYLDEIHDKYPNISVGVFAAAQMENLLASGTPIDLSGANCKNRTWNSLMGLPNVSSYSGTLPGPTNDQFLRLWTGDALCFHISPTSGISGNTDDFPLIADLPDFFNVAFNYKKTFSEEVLKNLPTGINAWITAYRNTEEDCKITNTWAHGLFAGLFTLLLMEDNRITKLAYHSFANDWRVGLFFDNENAFHTGSSIINPDPYIIAKQWGLSAVGLSLSQILEAMHDATVAYKVEFDNPPLLGGTNYPAVAAWVFQGNGAKEAIFINVSGSAIPMQSPLGLNTLQSYQQIYNPNPLCYVRGDDWTAYLIWNNTSSDWATVNNGDPNPNNGAIQNKMTITPNTTFYNSTNTLISLPAYSITRIKLLGLSLTSISVESPTVTVSANSDFTPGTLVNRTGTRLMVRGATEYKWKPITGLYGEKAGNNIGGGYKGSTVIASPSITTTYTVFGYYGTPNSTGSNYFDSETIVVAVDAPPAITIAENAGTTDAGSDVYVVECGNNASLTFGCSNCGADMDYWISPTEGVYEDAACGQADTSIHIKGATADFYFNPLYTTDYLITVVDPSTGYFSIKPFTIQLPEVLTIQHPLDPVCAGDIIDLKAKVGGTYCKNYTYTWYYIDDHNTSHIITPSGATNNYHIAISSANPDYPYRDMKLLVKAEYNSGSSCGGNFCCTPVCSTEILFTTTTVDISPSAIIAVNGDGDWKKDEYCEGEQIKIYGNEDAGSIDDFNNALPGEYNWTDNQDDILYPLWTDQLNTSTYTFTLPDDPDDYLNDIVIYYHAKISHDADDALFCRDDESIDEIKFKMSGSPPDFTINPSSPVDAIIGCPLMLVADYDNPLVVDETFSWFPTQYLDLPNGSSVVCTPGSNAPAIITYTAIAIDTSENPYGCCKEESIDVYVTPYNRHLEQVSTTTISCSFGIHFHYKVTELWIGSTYQWYYINGLQIPSATSPYLETCISPATPAIYCEITLQGGCVLNSDTLDYDYVLNAMRKETENVSNEFEQLQIIVYPNPANNLVRLSIDGINANEKIYFELLDLMGNKITHAEFTSNGFRNYYDLELNNSLASGIYLIRLRTVSQQKLIKLIIQK